MKLCCPKKILVLSISLIFGLGILVLPALFPVKTYAQTVFTYVAVNPPGCAPLSGNCHDFSILQNQGATATFSGLIPSTTYGVTVCTPDCGRTGRTVITYTATSDASGNLTVTNGITVDLNNQLVNVLPIVSPAGFITFIVRLLIVAAFIVAFIFLLIGGIRWIVAGGDEKSIAGAKSMLTGALIGLIIVLASFTIIKLIEYFFNVNIISGSLTLPHIGM